ncbi:hypothetical protein C8R47DRAFT_1193542 [Mycena vitilis]|nr:hypothetical protein C8R47DRAFT_1193542 [Mycena vitilis]
MNGQQNHPQWQADTRSTQHTPVPSNRHPQPRTTVESMSVRNRSMAPTITVDCSRVLHIHHQEAENGNGEWINVRVVAYNLQTIVGWLSDNISRNLGLPARKKTLTLNAEYGSSSAQSRYRRIYKNVEIKLMLEKTPPEVQIRPLACASMWARIEKGEGEKGTKLEIYWDNTAIYTGAREDDTGFYLQSKKAERRMFRLGFEGDVTRNCARHDPIVSEDIWGIILANSNSAAGEDPVMRERIQDQLHLLIYLGLHALRALTATRVLENTPVTPSSKCPPGDGNIGRVVRVDERQIFDPSLKEVQSRVGQSDLPEREFTAQGPPRIQIGIGSHTSLFVRIQDHSMEICRQSKAPGTAPEVVYRCKMHMGSFPLGGKPEGEFEDVFKSRIWPAKAGAKGEDKPLAWIKRDGELVSKLLGHAPEFFRPFLLGFGCRLQLLSESGKEREPDPHMGGRWAKARLGKGKEGSPANERGACRRHAWTVGGGARTQGAAERISSKPSACRRAFRVKQAGVGRRALCRRTSGNSGKS